MPARYVVMGHTHRPFMQALTDHATYVNLGNWAIDELNRSPKAPCSHLVIRHDVMGRPSAVLYGWDRRQGASVLRSDVAQDRESEPTSLTGATLVSPASPSHETFIS